MRVIEQTRLTFREGASDKVYEIDLVEVATNQYVVNFRFGRRGALRDGTRTAAPVSLEAARTIFGKLVAEKTAGGYKQDTGTPAAPVRDNGAAGGALSPTNAALVARLLRGMRDDDEEEIPGIMPAVWMAGARDLVEAEPALLELLDAGSPDQISETGFRYVLVVALARCGTTASLPALEKIARDVRERPYLRAMARAALVEIEPSRANELARPLMPPEITGPLDRKDVAGLMRAAEELLVVNAETARGAAIGLYLSNDPVSRAAVFAIARIARLNNAEAAIVRALFRLAELRRDGELYALVARRIDEYTGYTQPFSLRTRQYFRRRVARVLRRLARAHSPDYVAMAGALLLAYRDEDGEQPKQGIYDGTWYDRFARYHAFNDTLYGRSRRYRRAHHTRSAWECANGYRPGEAPPAAREERFPERWDAAPESLWQLVTAARATPVIEFATRALRDNRAFVDTLSDDALGAVLAGGHILAQQFAYDMVMMRPMSVALARGALASDVPDAQAWVLRWITEHLAEAARDPEMLALLVTGKTGAIRDTAMVVLRGRTLAPDLMRSVVARSLAILLGLPETADERARAASSLLLVALEAPLRELGADVLRDLIRHPLAALGELAGEAMLRHQRRETLPPDLLDALLSSPHPSVRTLGGRLLALTPPEVAMGDPEALIVFATSANGELREATRTLLGEVARRYPDVGRTIADRLVDKLLTPQPEGTPAHIVSLMRSELAACLPKKPAEMIMRLIGALSPHAREAGGLLLPQLGPDDLGLDEIIRLARHEILAVRQGAWALARAALPRFRIAQVAAARLADSPWEDTREFAAGFLRDDLKALTADAIITICDSIRPDVQALGRQLLHEQFQTADAGKYLVRLAEHPSTNLQLLVSAMLEHHVTGDLDRLRSLAPYLVTVLSQVNRGRVAKERVIALLRREAMRSVDHARLIAPILDRQSATIAITQKHPLIATLVDVATNYPDVSVPISIVPPRPIAKEGD